VWKNHGDCAVDLTPALLAFFSQKCRNFHKLVSTNIFNIPAALHITCVYHYHLSLFPQTFLTLRRPYIWQPKYKSGQLFKKPGDFDKNIHPTNDQVDVKFQNQLNLFYGTKNLFKKGMWEGIG